MPEQKYKEYYRGRLPHWQPVGATFFVTFRLKGSIPHAQLYKWRKAFEEDREKLLEQGQAAYQQQIDKLWMKYFLQYDAWLDKVIDGPMHLQENEIAAMVKNKLHELDGNKYDLMAYCIMSNHVHILIDTGLQLLDKNEMLVDETTAGYEPLNRIMFLVKGATAYTANKFLGRKGVGFWQKESYDHYVRSWEALLNILCYIANNPVKAGIVSDWEQYPHTYIKPTLM